MLHHDMMPTNPDEIRRSIYKLEDGSLVYTVASRLRVVRQIFLATEIVPPNIWDILLNAHHLTVGEDKVVQYVLPPEPLAAIPKDARRVPDPEPELPLVGFFRPFLRS